MNEEDWRAVVGWEGLYEVSSLGRVRSVDRIVMDMNRFGPSPSQRRGKIIRGWVAKRGYRCVRLSREGKLRACSDRARSRRC